MEMKAKIESLIADGAILSGERGEKIVLPASLLPAGLHAGNELYLSVKTPEERESEKAKRAKDILNELLKNAKNR